MRMQGKQKRPMWLRFTLMFAALMTLTAALTAAGSVGPVNTKANVLGPKPASACINCPGIYVAIKKHYTKVVLNGTVVTYGQYRLFKAANGGMPGPTWSGCFDEDVFYQLQEHYIWTTKTLFRTHIRAHWCWGPGDHINGYATPPPHNQYISNTCCYLAQNGQPDVLAYWYHLPGRNVDSGFKVSVHFSIHQCIPFMPGVPCGNNDIYMWLEMHGNGTDAYDGWGGKVIG